MLARLRRLVPAWTRQVPLRDCVHYCGFRYAREAYNPYGSYLRERAGGASDEAARIRFINFVLQYRPTDLGQALGVSLTKAAPLWLFPWARLARVAPGRPPGWLDDPEDIPDILTHFSKRGVPRYRVIEESGWLERAQYRISSVGYCPRRFSLASATQLMALDGRSVFLLIDGNHRAAALAALGHEHMAVSVGIDRIVRERELPSWFLVKKGLYSESDARAVFRAYFDRSPQWEVGTPTELIDC